MSRIGILGAADIAKRRFLPALCGIEELEFAGIACATDMERVAPFSENADEKTYSNSNREAGLLKVKAIVDEFGGEVYESYESIINDDSIDVLYIPLPPALHYYWGKKAIMAGKNVYMEKPFTTNLKDTKELIDLAKEKGVSVFENYGFTFNDQVKVIDSLIKEKTGDIRLVRANFGFPKRSDSDFRYNKKLGGGALLDAGGYTIKIARHYLGDSMRIVAACFNDMPGHDVDGWGSVMAVNDEGITCQLAFGMDNQYKCDLEIWGSVGTVHAPRIFTPPPQFVPVISLTTKDGTETFEAQPGDAFAFAISEFVKCFNSKEARCAEYEEILTQGRLVEETCRMSGIH